MRIILLTFISLAFTITQISAQHSGRKFIRGAASVNLHKRSLPQSDARQLTSNLSADISKGKFLTEERATGFMLSGGLDFSSYREPSPNLYPIYQDKANGIQGFHLGVGKFWQFYKHFGNNWGLYGEPAINANYRFSETFQNESTFPYYRTLSNTYEVRLTLTAGAYYRLSEKWWLNASIGFSNPLTLSFGNNKYETFNSSHNLEEVSKQNVFNYEFRPTLNIPSVGLGLTYFLK